MRGSTVMMDADSPASNLDAVVWGQGLHHRPFPIHMRRDPDGRDLDLMLRTDGLALHGLKAGVCSSNVTLQQARALAPLLRERHPGPEAVANWRHRAER